MSFGYLGDTSTKIKQQVKNAGVISISENLDLQHKGHLGSSMKLITSASFSSSSSIQVTNCKETEFDVHYFVINFGQGSNHDVTAFMDFSTNGGTSYETADFEYGMQWGQTNATSSGSFSTGLYGLLIAQSFNSYDRNYCVKGYIYNMGTASKSTAVSVIGYGSRSGSETYRYMYGGGQSGSSDAHNAFRFYPNTGTLTGSYQLYGLKEV